MRRSAVCGSDRPLIRPQLSILFLLDRSSIYTENYVSQWSSLINESPVLKQLYHQWKCRFYDDPCPPSFFVKTSFKMWAASRFKIKQRAESSLDTLQQRSNSQFFYQGCPSDPGKQKETLRLIQELCLISIILDHFPFIGWRF